MGAGDEVPEGLTQMGYKVTLVNLRNNNWKTRGIWCHYDGIRAYNVLHYYASKQKILLDFVKSGKTMIVQYNTPDSSIPADIAPYPLKISRDQ
jgi:hypothetical protein